MSNQYQNPNIPTQNTPRGLVYDAALIPSAYKVERFLITNQSGKTMDIANLVTSFTIVEEIFSPVVVLNARIRDNINFFEDFGISGQEMIYVKLSKHDWLESDTDTSTIELNLTVKEYPNYEKSSETLDAQEYNLIAISEYAYLSALQRISRSIHGNTVANIEKIFVNDLNVKSDLIDSPNSKYPCVTNFDGVITIQSPLKATEWIRNKAFDNKGAPFFIFTSISKGKIKIKSWSSMIDDDNFYPYKGFSYKLKAFSDSQPLTKSSYAERMEQILGLRSNIKLDKLQQATMGGFANKVQVTDFGVKTFTEKLFGIDRDKMVMDNRLYRDTQNFKYSEWGQAFGFLSGSSKSTHMKYDVSKMHDASISQISTVSGSNNASSVFSDHMNTAKSYLANMESESHEIIVYGDFRLNPGRKIKIEIPKAANIDEYNEKINPKIDKPELDLRLSGEYVIAVAAHTFANGIYSTRVKIIRDNS